MAPLLLATELICTIASVRPVPEYRRVYGYSKPESVPPWLRIGEWISRVTAYMCVSWLSFVFFFSCVPVYTRNYPTCLQQSQSVSHICIDALWSNKTTFLTWSKCIRVPSWGPVSCDAKLNLLRSVCNKVKLPLIIFHNLWHYMYTQNSTTERKKKFLSWQPFFRMMEHNDKGIQWTK
jgi:hypothetical protein